MSQIRKEQIHEEIRDLLMDVKQVEKKLNTLWKASYKIIYSKPESVHNMNKSRKNH